jgi:wyosine [tRNA(Phe)-imidazoG37] synthetase (radical SAM superfamily)
MISFGPVPSRRLGKSLGINNIPSKKVCSYSCIYCQVGVTKEFSIAREQFYEPEIIFNVVQKHLEKLKEADKPDYLTFVSNGEPTIDINLGKSIKRLKELHIPIAVITNGSLLTNKKVRDDLHLADWISVKIEANDKTIWKAVNRPSEWIDFEKHNKGFLQFSSEYKGKLITETMLVQGVNDSPAILKQTARLISQINPYIAYISVPTRPPTLSRVKAPDELVINEAYQVFSEKELKVELLLGFEGTNAGFTGNAIEDIINICSVHPIREDTMKELLVNDNADTSILNSLMVGKYVRRVQYNSKYFYIRQFHV